MSEKYNLEIKQGETFNQVTIVMEGDYREWEARGQIRDNYASRNGVIKAVFSFERNYNETIVNGVTLKKTSIKPIIEASETEKIDFEEIRNNEPYILGKNVWVYDIEIFKNNLVRRILEGIVTISLEVTR